MKTNLFKKILRSYSLTLLLSYGLMLSLQAQTDENFMLDSATIQKNELIVTPEKIEEVIGFVRSTLEPLPDSMLDYYGIKSRAHLKSLQLKEPIPMYEIENGNLKFTGSWQVPGISDGEPIFLADVRFINGQYPRPRIGSATLAALIHNYEYKDLIVGILTDSEMRYYLYVRKENKDIFVQIYDQVARQYLKNEYSLSDIIHSIASTDSGQKNQLIMTQEIAENIVTHNNNNPERKSQWMNFQFGKPIPEYWIDLVNENLQFSGRWHILVMSSGGNPLYIARVRLENDGQYYCVGSGSAPLAEPLHNYKHKELIIGTLRVSASPGGMDYFIIRKDNRDIFVETYDYASREYFKNEFTLSEIINLLKK